MGIGSGDVIGDRFVLERLAGTGGMGSVFRANDRASGHAVAIKVLAALADPQRFLREAAILSELRHPAIVGYVSHGAVGGTPYLAMEWLDGEDLAARLAGGAMPIADAIALVARIADAVGFAHAQGIVHRDLKPSNVFLPDGRLDRATLLDFGIARTAAGVAMTRTGSLLGTPAYMSPEQASGERAVDARSDVFALGCLLFEAVAGRPAFRGDHVMAVLAKILFEEPPRLDEHRPDAPSWLDRFVSRMLAKDPMTRPADGIAVARELVARRDDAAGDTVEGSAAASAVPALTRVEQRFVSVVLASAEQPADAAHAATVAESLDTVEHVRRLLASLPARVQPLVDGSVACVISGLPSAVEQATLAARCALTLRRARPRAAVSLATGRAVLVGRMPVGEAIDRAAALIRERAPSDGVAVDETTAGLLGPELVVGGDELGLVLRGERDAGDEVRTLLGKPTPYVGRDKELAFLEGLFAECSSESIARAVLVTAPPGVGKSRLRRELVARIRGAAQIWLGRCDAFSAGTPLGTLARLLRDELRLQAGESLEVQERKIRARVGRRFDDADVGRIATYLGELAGAPFRDDDDAPLRAARGDPRIMGDRMQAAWLDLIGAESADRPLVIVLDDLHWGDRSSIEYIDLALRALHDHPLLVVALARPEVETAFPRLWAERDLHTIRLAGLTPRAAERLVRDVLGDRVVDDDVAALVRQAGGNAFFLEELIRAHTSGLAGLAPMTVVAMAQARLDAVDPESRRVLRAASVLGEVFWRGGVAAMLGGDATGLDARLDQLVATELLVHRGAGRFVDERELSFRHALGREAAYGTLTDADRTLGHQLAAEWLERAGEPEPIVLAEHFERGARPDRAAEYYGRAAAQALDNDDMSAAMARAQRGIACGVTGLALGELYLVQASAHDWRGENVAAARRGREAMARLPAGGSAWHSAACCVAVACRRMGDRGELIALAEELVAQRPEGVLGMIERRCLGRILVQLVAGGLPEHARELRALLEHSEQIAPTTDPLAQLWIWAGRGIAAMFDRDPGLLLNEGDRMIALADAAGDVRTACNLRFYVGVAASGVGEHAACERHLREGIALGEPLGIATLVSTMRTELAGALIGAGRTAEARGLAEQALRDLENQGDRFRESSAHRMLARALAQDGELDGALEHARTAAELADAAPPFRRGILATLAENLLLRGDHREALLAARTAAAIGVDASFTFADDSTTLVYAEALWASGDLGGAREAIRVAREQLLAAADHLAVPRWRESFLAQSHHARLLARADEWLA